MERDKYLAGVISRALMMVARGIQKAYDLGPDASKPQAEEEPKPKYLNRAD